nr:hypothetical protein [Spirosomataceae bacterium]
DKIQEQNPKDWTKRGNSSLLIQYARLYEKIVQIARKTVADGKQAEQAFRAINPQVDYGKNVGRSFVGNKKIVVLREQKIVVLREQNNLWLQSHIDKKLVLTPLFMPDSSMTFCVQSRTVLWASSLPHNGDFKHKYSDLSFIT